MSDAYTLGFDAYERGDQKFMNPYDDRDGQHAEWIEGFEQAEFSDSEFDAGN